MKAVHILLLFAVLSHAQAQQSYAPRTGAVTVSTQNFREARDLSAYYQPGNEQKARWYVSADLTTQQTRILFFDKDQRVLYEEKLPGQYLELTGHNQRVLDQTLAQLCANQLITERLKTKPFHTAQPENTLTFDAISSISPTTTTSPTGMIGRVFISEKKLLCFWVKPSTPQKITLSITDGSGRTVRSSTSKGEQFTDSMPLPQLPEDVYSVRLHGKTWEYNYELRISEGHGRRHIELLQK
jgi:hypothetical protein